MSGQYTPRHGVLYVGIGDYQDKYKARVGNLEKFPALQPKGKTTLPHSTQTLAETLQAGGYQTAMFGKWHLGRNDHHQSQRGFDVAIESAGAHFGFKTDPEIQHPKELTKNWLVLTHTPRMTPNPEYREN